MTARHNWSNDRIDGLERKVDDGFQHVDRRLEQVDKRLDRIEQTMSERFTAFESRFQALEDGLRSVHRTQVILFIGLFGSFLGLLVTLITVTLVQL